MAKKTCCGHMRRALAGALAALSLCTCMIAPMMGCAKTITYTLEAGEDLPSPYRLVGADGAAYVAGFDESCVNRPGKYTIPMTDAEGRKYNLKLTVHSVKRNIALNKLCIVCLDFRNVYFFKTLP